MAEPFPRLARPSRAPLLLAIVGVSVVAAMLLHARRDTAARKELSRQTQMRDALKSLRGALATYKQKHGRGPARLDDLVRDGELREIPLDPVTGARDWHVTIEESVAVSDFAANSAPKAASAIIAVHSSAPGWAEY